MLTPTENCAAAIAGIAANAPTIRTLERNGRLQVFIQTPVAQSCVTLNAPHQFFGDPVYYAAEAPGYLFLRRSSPPLMPGPTQPRRLFSLSVLHSPPGKEAAAEFQKILDHSGLLWNCWTGVSAHLGLARANALQAKSSHGADADAARVRALCQLTKSSSRCRRTSIRVSTSLTNSGRNTPNCNNRRATRIFSPEIGPITLPAPNPPAAYRTLRCRGRQTDCLPIHSQASAYARCDRRQRRNTRRIRAS